MITIERAGVISLTRGYETGLQVNQEDLLQLLSEEIEKAAPPSDYNGVFAGSVKIEVKFYPDDIERSKT